MQAHNIPAGDDDETDPTVSLLQIQSAVRKYIFFSDRKHCLFCFLLQRYFENRVRMLDSLRTEGMDPYPHKFEVGISIADYVAKYNSLGAGEHLSAVTESLAGIVSM